VVREGVGAGGRNDPSLVCTYELKKIKLQIIEIIEYTLKRIIQNIGGNFYK
jgi:hypothetical protein